MKIEYFKTESLIPYEFNNRNHNEEQINRIANSITQFSFNQPIVIDESNIILVGHGRHLAAKKLGLKEVPVLVKKDLSETQKKAYRILDNKLQNDSTWSFDNLDLELGFLEDNGFELEPWGLGDLRDLFDQEEPEVSDDEFDESECENNETFIKLGDLIELGAHRVMCGDSTSAEDVGQLMIGQVSELLFTSPPYADMREYDGNDLDVSTIAGFIPAFSSSCNFLVFNLGIQRKDHSIVEYWDTYIHLAKSEGLKFLAWNVWWKNTISIGQQSAFFPIEHEFIFVFGREFKDINRTKERKTPKRKENTTTRRQADGTLKHSSIGVQLDKKEMGSVFNSNSELGEIRKMHPATFPIELPSEYIRAVTNPGDFVSDPFLGSGTTLIAADQLNRICYGMEISPKYCHVIIERYKKHCEKKGKKFECKINGEPYNG